jgi:hypothetical protein
MSEDTNKESTDSKSGELQDEELEKASGASRAADSGKWFTADSFSFGAEQEMKESGEKGGTEDLNIGVGELQEADVERVDKLKK